MTRQSKIYRGQVVHERMTPTNHAFTYPMTFFGFDLGELSDIERSSTLLGYNQSRPLRINDCDYLRGSRQPIFAQLNEFLPSPEPGQRTVLISSPRYFGYAFNPVNFYLRMDGEQLVAAVAEVNNTFGDRHIYPLQELQPEGTFEWSARSPKEFHVSPFNDLAGEYRFTFRIEAEEIFLGVDLWKDGACVMKTWVQGNAMPLSNHRITRYALLRPFDTALNSMPRILWQAALLYFRKKMPVYRRPSPSSAHTLVDRDKPEGERDVV